MRQYPVKCNKFLPILLFGFIVSVQAQILPPLPKNPFGVGVPYSFFKIYKLSDRADYRNSQLANASTLVGRGGYVRIWCFLDVNFEGLLDPEVKVYDGPTECVGAVEKAHSLGLIPVVLFQDGVWKDENSPKDANGAYEKFFEYSSKVADVVSSLDQVTPNGRVVWVEMANEPNWSESWFSKTGSESIQAAEVAYQSKQTIDAIRSRTQNSPKIKILGPALSPYGSMSNPNSNGVKPFSQKSDQFVLYMKAAVPGLFKKYDAWNSHAYPQVLFTDVDCSKDDCSLDKQYGLTAYRHELQAAGLGSDTPVILTEAGLWNNQQGGADFMAADFDSNGRGSGAFPQVWFAPGKQYNNMQAVIGFMLGINTTSFAPYNWLDPWRSIGIGGPLTQSDWTPIFRRVVEYREKVLPTAKLSEGRYLLPSGAIVYANNVGQYCQFSDMDSFLYNGGSPDLSNVKSIVSLPLELVSSDVCNSIMPEGRYRIPNGAIYYSNGKGGLCSYGNMDEFKWGGGNSNLSNVKSVTAIPFAANTLQGKCNALLPVGRYRTPNGIKYYSYGNGQYCSYPNMAKFLSGGGKRDLSNVTSISSIPPGNQNQGNCR